MDGRIVDQRLLTGGAGLRHREGGFTLVEAVVSVGIALTVMLAVLTMFGTALRVFDSNRDLTVAANLANSKIADFRTKTVAELKAENPKTDTVTMRGVQYVRSWTVSDIDVDGDSNPDMVDDIVKVDLDVDWTSGGRSRNVSMSTLTTGKPQL